MVETKLWRELVKVRGEREREREEWVLEVGGVQGEKPTF